ncbi:cytochrome P450 [Poronia punctata]|nr:cytochrome P450 [Poronia punctata]
MDASGSSSLLTTCTALCCLSVTVLCAVVLLTLETFRPIDKKWLRTSRWKLPAGPPGQPIFGNLSQMMEARSRPGAFTEWLASLKPHGEMVTLHMGSNTWVFLNSDRVVSELISKRGKITNERPHMPIASDLVSRGKRTVIQPEKDWKEGRRVMHQLLSGSNLKVYAAMQELESVDLLRRYLSQPDHWYAHNYRYATSVLYRVVMGYPLKKTKAELDEYQRVTTQFVLSINRSMVDFFPALSRLPRFLQPWRKFWHDMGTSHYQFLTQWWAPVRKAVKDGSAPPSFVRDVLLHPEIRFKGNDEEAMYIAGSVMAAGGDNTRMTMNTFIMAMATRPEVQKRAREEVDRVCRDGDNLRLPRMTDLPDMPYVEAMIKETLRWRPTVPMIPPHQLTEDLVFDGYFLPAGTSFIINSVALAHEFPDPDIYDPERWLGGGREKELLNFWGFGGGRRMCVGWKVAQQALFLAFANLLFCFELVPNGPIDDKGLNHHTLDEPFPVKPRLRSPEHAQLIEREASRYAGSFSTF